MFKHIALVVMFLLLDVTSAFALTSEARPIRSVPEPGSLALLITGLGTGVGSLLIWRKRK